MSEMNKALAVAMGNEVMEAVNAIAAKYGYSAKRGSGKYDSVSYKMNNIQFYQSGNTGSKYSASDEDKMKRDFDYNKNIHGLGDVNVGDEYTGRDGVRMKVVGWKARNRKYPVLVQKVVGGGLYKVAPSGLKQQMFGV